MAGCHIYEGQDVPLCPYSMNFPYISGCTKSSEAASSQRPPVSTDTSPALEPDHCVDALRLFGGKGLPPSFLSHALGALGTLRRKLSV